MALWWCKLKSDQDDINVIIAFFPEMFPPLSIKFVWLDIGSYLVCRMFVWLDIGGYLVCRKAESGSILAEGSQSLKGVQQINRQASLTKVGKLWRGWY